MRPAIWTGLYAELPLHQALETLYGQGWRSFEVSTEHLVQIDVNPETAISEVRSTVEELDIEIPQAHAYLQADVACSDKQKRESDLKLLDGHLSHCAALGVKVVVMHPGGRIAEPTNAERRKTRELNIEGFRELGAIADSLGLRIGLENLMRNGFVHPDDLIELIDDIGGSVYGVTLDTSHANVVKLDIPAMIRRLGPLLIAAHISDNDGSGDQHRTPGSGHIDWPPIAAAFKEIGYSGLFNLEIPGERHALPELRTLKSRHALNVANWLTAAKEH
jgi:L-ribulose-5-phosphate 3-epimerase